MGHKGAPGDYLQGHADYRVSVSKLILDAVPPEGVPAPTLLALILHHVSLEGYQEISRMLMGPTLSALEIRHTDRGEFIHRGIGYVKTLSFLQGGT